MKSRLLFSLLLACAASASGASIDLSNITATATSSAGQRLVVIQPTGQTRLLAVSNLVSLIRGNDFTVVQLPDQQYSAAYGNLLSSNINWILARAKTNNTVAVVLPGDLVDFANASEIQMLTNNLWRLRTNNPPISVIPSVGNHEWLAAYGFYTNLAGMNNALWPLVSTDPAAGEWRTNGDYSSGVWKFTNGGRKLAFVTIPFIYTASLQMNTNAILSAAEWAKTAAGRLPDHQVVAVYHSLLNSTGVPDFPTSQYYLLGGMVWSNLVSAPNIVQAMAGHWATNGLTNSVLFGSSGNAVQGVLFNMHYGPPSNSPFCNLTTTFGTEFVLEHRWNPDLNLISSTTWNTRSNLQVTAPGASFVMPIAGAVDLSAVRNGGLGVTLNRNPPPNNNNPSGANSFAVGSGTTASGLTSTAMGNGTTASGNWSTCIGANSTASGLGSVAIGAENQVSGQYAIGVGLGSINSGDRSFLFNGIVGGLANNQSYWTNTLPYSFTVRATNGIRLIGSPIYGNGEGLANLQSTNLEGAFVSKGTNGANTQPAIQANGLVSGSRPGITILTNGNVGIGTTAPGVKLDVSGVGAFISIDRTGAEPALILKQDGNGLGRFSGSSSGGFKFQSSDSGVTWMNITTNGSIGIGTITPATKLDVAGTVNAGITNSTVPGFRSAGTNNMVLRSADGGTFLLRVSNDGTLTAVTNTGGL